MPTLKPLSRSLIGRVAGRKPFDDFGCPTLGF
jgi:hypothetical protein